MQNDLISRSLLLAGGNVRKVTEYDEGGWGLTYRAVPEQAIKNAPAVDAVPVVHARWEWYEDWGPSTWLEPPDLNNEGWKCSNCGIDLGDYLTNCLGVNVYVDEEDKMPKIKSCPNCGAKMDGGCGRMRLIDAVALKKDFEERQKLSESGEECTDCFRNDAQELSTEWWCVEDAVDSAPTIDAVPVVRCSECKKCRKRESKLGIHWCNQWDNVVRDTDFCSFGERKADGGADT